MAVDSSDQNDGSWKQKYYFQLDQLEEKEKEWTRLEGTLKKAISRISLAAEGSNDQIDKHLEDVREIIRDKVNHHRLDLVINDLSRIIAKVEEQKKITSAGRLTLLSTVLQNIHFPAALEKQQKSLLKKITQSAEADLETLLSEIKTLINSATQAEATSDASRPGLFKRLLGGDDKTDDIGLESYRECLLSIVDSLMRTGVAPEKVNAFKQSTNSTNEKVELERLSDELVYLLHDVEAPQPNKVEIEVSDDSMQPSIQELIIRLLEQLLVPNDLIDDVNNMKDRLEQENDPADWKILLKDVAELINTIRSRMQEEKNEFEDFLQTITGRLNDIDEFLQTESRSIKQAEDQRREFDNKLNSHVDVIRNDVFQATELSTLKQVVTARIDVISDHIKEYRDTEEKRFKEAINNISGMKSRMVSLEEEAVNLRKVIAEKNKEALFDVLTDVPNRLAFEKKVAEEIARWKRFENPLSMAIWDVDFFKKVNDSYGHKAGDRVLRTIAQVLNERIRETDFLARYGGEEFVMLLPGTKEEETLRLVNDLRERIASCNFSYQGEAVQITASCGVSCFRKEDTNWTSVFERADKALYQAKKSGRNRCVVSSCRSD